MLPIPCPYVKDAFHEFVVSGRVDAVNPAKTGTKAAAYYILELPAGSEQVINLRLFEKGQSPAERIRRGIRSYFPEADRGSR